MADAVARAIQTLTLKASCSHCGNECAELRRCSVCKHASYCGAACQNAAWKKHKKKCVTLEEVKKRVDAAVEDKDWRRVLKWEGRLEQMLEGRSDAARDYFLHHFKWAHSVASNATGSTDHALAAVRLQDRRIELLGKMERFRDQGAAMCEAAGYVANAGKRHESAAYLQRARDVGAAHGFFSVECRACLGLGRMALEEGRHEEGLDLQRNALAASSLREDEGDTRMELNVLAHLTEALFQTHKIDEVEPLVLRYREAAKAESQKVGRVCFMEQKSLYISAQLHEVGTPSHPAALGSTKAASVYHRSYRARIKTHDLFEFRSAQARGKPHEAEREVRALLDLVRENGASVRENLMRYHIFLERVTSRLNILDPELGVQELVKSAAAELAKVTALIAENRQRQ